MDVPLSQTKLDLMLAAERLVARHGVEALTVRRINIETGQKNNSAVHYHFGSLDGLVEAVARFRLPDAEAQREALIAQAKREAGAGPAPTSALADILVSPPLERLLSLESPNHFMRFSNQLLIGDRIWRRFADLDQSPTFREVRTMLGQALPFLPQRLVDARFTMALSLALGVLADVEADQEKLGPAFDPRRARLRAAELRSAVAAIFDMPVGAGTLALLDPQEPPEQGRGGPAA